MLPLSPPPGKPPPAAMPPHPRPQHHPPPSLAPTNTAGRGNKPRQLTINHRCLSRHWNDVKHCICVIVHLFQSLGCHLTNCEPPGHPSASAYSVTNSLYADRLPRHDRRARTEASEQKRTNGSASGTDERTNERHQANQLERWPWGSSRWPRCRPPRIFLSIANESSPVILISGGPPGIVIYWIIAIVGWNRRNPATTPRRGPSFARRQFLYSARGKKGSQKRRSWKSVQLFSPPTGHVPAIFVG